jgi:HPt (histidine-containing phosphotransfer) domain-containing protein
VPASKPELKIGPADSIKSTMTDYPGMARIIVEFVQGLPSEVRKLEACLKAGKTVELRRAVHQLRGACGGYGFDGLTDLASAAENAILAADSVDVVGPHINSLIEMIRRIEGYEERTELMAA